jgi:transposase-like protein
VVKHEVRRYSEAFKLQVVRDVESGRFATPYAAERAYGIKGRGTVGCWLRRYGKDHLLGKVVHVMKADEQSEVKGLRQRVRELERALADAYLDLKLEEGYVEVACEEAGIKDVAEFKKKHAGVR